MTTRRLKMVQAVLAGLTVLAASADLRNVLPEPWPTWLVLVTGAAAASVGYLTAHVGDMPADHGPTGRHALPESGGSGPDLGGHGA